VTKNDIFRRLCKIFKLNAEAAAAVCAAADAEVTKEQVADWLKKPGETGCRSCSDRDLAIFLNGLINSRRGRKDGPQPEPEEQLSYNMIFNKLKIALNLQAEPLLAMMQEEGLEMSKHELSALFRKVDHKHYRPCSQQQLSAFLRGIENLLAQQD